MLAPPKKLPPDPQVKRLSVKNWLNGTVTAFDDGRTPLDGLKSAGNVFLQQDGTVRPRPSMVRYGPQPTGKVLGQIFEFKKVTGLTTENWLICMQSFLVSRSPSASLSPSSSLSPSASQSMSPSSSQSRSPSASLSPSSSRSPSASLSPSSSSSRSLSPSASRSPSASTSLSPSASMSPSASNSPSASVSASPSAPTTAYGQIFIARGEDTTWTAVTGKYYDTEAFTSYFQIGAKVVIMNGVDTLSYLDIPTSLIVPFAALPTPAAPTLNTNNVGAGAFPVTYRVTINSAVGQTAASNVLSTSADTDRDNWTGTDNIVINLPSIGAGSSYNVYCGVAGGLEFLIASGIASTATTFTDTGNATMPQDTSRKFPTADSTAGPKVSRGEVIGGRAFLVGDKDSPYAVWFGGDHGFEMDFSPANGGGTQFIGEGTKDVPIAIKSFRDGRGNPQIVVLCQGTNGSGKRFIMTPDPITFGSTIINTFDVTEDSGQDGTDSPYAIITYGTDLHYPSRDGFKTTGTQPQIQNVLSTRRTSNTIQPDLKLLNGSAMDGAVGLGFEGRLYWALPVNASTNTEIWVLDLDRKGAWMKPWTVSADWMTLYNDNNGNTHHLILSNNLIYSLSYSALTTDDSEPFLTNGQSGEIYFSDDKRMWVQLLMVIVVLASPQGTINFQISGKTEDNPIIGLGEATSFVSATNSTVAGWGEVNKYIKGFGRNAWSKVNLVPSNSSSATQECPIEIDEEIQWFSYSWNTTTSGVDYNISDIIAEYIEVGIKDLS